MREKYFGLYTTGKIPDRNKPTLESIRKSRFEKIETPFHDLSELPPNAFEQKTIDECFRALKQFCDAIDEPDVPMPKPNQIHILPSMEYHRLLEKVGEDQARSRAEQTNGMVHKGHIYLKKLLDQNRFAVVLPHEVAHVVSFQSEHVAFSWKGVERTDRQIGSQFLTKPKDGEALFSGVHEIQTEMFAMGIRHLMDFSSLGLKDDPQLHNPSAYLTHFIVWTALLKEIYTAEHGLGYWMTMSNKDLLRGTYRVLKAMETKNKGTVKILAAMGSEPEDALEAAQALGLDQETIDTIKQLLETLE